MDSIKLRGDRYGGNTIISNCFIDNFLAGANEAQLKIYLYLSRCIGSDTPVDVSSIADRFNYTEKDVCRALDYWAKAGIILLEFDSDREITGITLNDPADAAQSRGLIGDDHQVQFSEKSLSSGKARPRKSVSYSSSKVTSFGRKPEVRELIFAVETYMRQTLSRKDMESLLFMYDELKFPVDLIEFLIEHCLESGADKMSYFMEVALSWDEKGIHDVAQAREYVRLYQNRTAREVMKEFGISGRNVTPVEAEYIDRWEKQYGFDLDIIREAASRTIKQTAKPSFTYADRILSSWHTSGVKSVSDIEVLDKNHSESTRSRYRAGRTSTARIQTNRFKNFSERDYGDMSDLEKELILKSMAKAGTNA